MRIDILTIFPQYVDGLLNESIVKRAREKGIIEIHVHNLRDFANNPRHNVDDRPFGGGAGMVMMVEPIYLALKSLDVYPTRPADTKILLTAAAGEKWQQKKAQDFSQGIKRLVIICGHYEGIDQRVSDHLIDEEVSIGDFVLTGGELAAGVIVDSITRLLPGALGNPQSLEEESHSEEIDGEYPHYTRPAEFETEENITWRIPEILLSGNHAEIEKWRKENSQ